MATMRFHTVVVLVLVAVVVSALFLASASARKLSQTDGLISELCKKTDYADLCITSVTENVKGKPTGVSILNAEIDAATKGVNVALAQVAKLTKSASKREKVILDTCKENYGYAIDSLNDAKTSVRTHDRGSVNTQLSASISYVSTCDDSYDDFSLPSPFKKLDKQVIHLSGNSLAIVKEIVL